jgi:uncharacterized delta-60 repeat protein
MPDGRAVLAGSDGGKVMLARYLPNGDLDTSFGRAGKRVAPRPFGSILTAIAVAGDGRINLVGGGDDGVIWLARYLADGRRDRGFGTSFAYLIPEQGGDEVAIQPDGKIVIAGSGYGEVVGLQRFVPDGQSDQSFGSEGVVSTDFGFPTGAEAIAIQNDGKIVVGGGGTGRVGKHYEDTFVLARYSTDGRLDRSFGKGGTVSTEADGLGWDTSTVVIQEDGKIVAAGDGLVRYTSDGRLDRTFGVVAKP